MKEVYSFHKVAHVVTGVPLWFVRKDGERATLNLPSLDEALEWVKRDASPATVASPKRKKDEDR